MKFIKYTKLWLTLSTLVILVGVGAMIYNKVQTGAVLKYGIDFTGGTVMELDFETEREDSMSEDEFKNLISESFLAAYPAESGSVRKTGAGTYTIATQDIPDGQLEPIFESFRENVGEFELIQLQSIGPKIGETLKRRAVIALAIALVAIVLYIAYAFRKVPKKVSKWKFGFAAIIALAHDILITLGLFALLGFEVNSFFITALLTIMGFSVHDTIVVFDRIRENLKKQGRDDTFGDVADASLNQTMARSLNTSISTLFPLLALYIWGSPAIQTFTFALLVGILVGTYSSIFIASPVLSLWQERGRAR